MSDSHRDCIESDMRAEEFFNRQIESRDRTIADLGASNASLIRRVADLENQLAEAKNRTEEQRIAVGVFADGMKRRQAELELLRPIEQAARAYRKASDALQNFDGRRDNLGDLADTHAAAREAVAAALDAYDAAGNGETADQLSAPELGTVTQSDLDTIAYIGSGGFKSKDVSVQFDDEDESPGVPVPWPAEDVRAVNTAREVAGG